MKIIPTREELRDIAKEVAVHISDGEVEWFDISDKSLAILSEYGNELTEFPHCFAEALYQGKALMAIDPYTETEMGKFRLKDFERAINRMANDDRLKVYVYDIISGNMMQGDANIFLKEIVLSDL